MSRTLTVDDYRRLTTEQQDEVDAWLRAEGLMEQRVVELTFLSGGEVEVTAYKQPLRKGEDGNAVRRTFRHRYTNSLPDALVAHDSPL